MKLGLLVCAALAAVVTTAAAWADDPKDPGMRSAAARARDREIIRELNRQELARVQARDARYAEGWRAHREATEARGAPAEQWRGDRQAMADYARERTQYERELATWRRAVAACRAGDYSACDY